MEGKTNCWLMAAISTPLNTIRAVWIYDNSPGCSLQEWRCRCRRRRRWLLVKLICQSPVPVSGIWWQSLIAGSPLPPAVNNNKVMESERKRREASPTGAFFSSWFVVLWRFSEARTAFRSQHLNPSSSLALIRARGDGADQLIRDRPLQRVFKDHEPPLQSYDNRSPCD